MNIGVLCPSEIAIRRFMPALVNVEELTFVGVGTCLQEEREQFSNKTIDDSIDPLELRIKQQEKASEIISIYGGRIFSSYKELVTSDEIDAVYIPLPPALHFKWAKIALEHGKHVLIEKPSTTSARNSFQLIEIARKNNIALYENYMFVHHRQQATIDQIIQSGELGDIRLFRISFGFPRRSPNDFRYVKKAGGGALLDAGGYTIRYATHLLGSTMKLKYAQLNYLPNFEVDMYGSGAFVNDNGLTAQVAFGMDNEYKCELEVWGSQGTLYTNRVLTAPVGYEPTLRITRAGKTEDRTLPSDDAFSKSIRRFIDCTNDKVVREKEFQNIEVQAMHVEEFSSKG